MKYKLSHYDNNTPIEKIHLVYLKLKKRKEKRRKVFSDFIDSISTLIEPTNKKYTVFFVYPDKEVGKYTINYDNYWGGWSFSRDRLIPKTRDEKLDYLEDTELKFELGKKFKELEALTRDFLCSYFEDVLLTKIKNKFFNEKNYEEDIKEIIIINNIKYLFIRINSKVELINLDEKQPIII